MYVRSPLLRRQIWESLDAISDSATFGNSSALLTLFLAECHYFFIFFCVFCCCRQGIRLANEIDDKQLFIDSGDILEQQKQYSEAASMFIKV